MSRPFRWPVLAICAAFVAACSDAPPTSPVETAPLLDRTTAPGQFSFYGLGGLNSAGAAHPCRTAAHDQFDFWVGDWNVFGPSGAQAGTNRVVQLLDNCLVEENWTGSFGGRGRSMNAYDAATGEWSQYWVDQFGTHLRLFGGLEGESMVMDGPHLIPTQSGSIVPIFFRIEWSPMPGGSVNQLWDASIDGGTTFPFVFFDGDYVSTDDFQPVPPLAQSFCPNPEYDQLDFLIGTWTVETPGGRALGTSVVREDMENCLLEEDFTDSAGYASQSFAGWDFTNETWYRNHLDSEGNLILLSGGVAGDAMVMTGVRPRSGGGQMQVRVTIRPDGPNRIIQAWETTNGSGQWKADGSVVFVRD